MGVRIKYSVSSEGPQKSKKMYCSGIELACFALSLVLAFTWTGTQAVEYYVVPSNRSENSTLLNCKTLNDYATDPTAYFINDSTFYFLPGKHSLDDGRNITVQDVSGLVLKSANHSACGYTPEKNETPVIDCSRDSAGFSFILVSDLEISGINIKSCGQVLYTQNTSANRSFFIDHWSATISLANVTNFQLKDSYIEDSHGYAIFAKGVYGNSTIKNCHFKGNIAAKYSKYEYLHGGNIAIRYNGSCLSASYFEISESNISDGYSAAYGGAIDLILNCNDRVIHFVLDGVQVYNNSGYGSEKQPSSIAIQLLALPDEDDTNSITVTNCKIGWTDFNPGNAINVAIYIRSKGNSPKQTGDIAEVLTFKGSTSFLNNTSTESGVAIHMRLYDASKSTRKKIGILFDHTVFENNIYKTDTLRQSSGIAVYIILFRAGGSSLHSFPQYHTKFDSCTFRNNHILNHPSFGSGALYVEEHPDVVFENCTVSDNNCTGIAAVHSSLRFRGNNTITRNSAQSGGGIMLVDNSVLLLTENTSLLIIENNASNTGGGIYAEYGSTSAVPICFFQFDTNTLLSENKLKTISVTLHNNTARIGNALYGGHIDSCYFLVNNTPWVNRRLLNERPGNIFDKTFAYNTSDKGAISSDALRVCFCEKGVPNCKNTTMKLKTFPGKTFSVEAVVVGQRQGITSGIIIAQFFNASDITISKSQTTYKVDQSCSQLKYTINTKKVGVTANLSLDVPRSSYIVGHSVIELEITRCPLGFKLNDSKCSCICALKTVRCTTDFKIHRPVGLWVGYNTRNNSNIPRNKSMDIIVHRCPHLYCRLTSFDMITTVNHIEQDSQCYFHRRGLLCGQCKEHLSMVFGTPRCIDCRIYHGWKALGITCALALAGIVLVIFLILCDFTVTKGTINGFILYANIIEAARDTYFPLKQDASQDSPTYIILRTFIAWLNLDLGVQTCYYNGMNTYEKTCLQFVFPIYIWMITGILIWLSRRSALVTRLMKDNGTKVLATLILLSYAKLMRTIATCLNGANLDSGHTLWFYDASEPYFYGKHLVLFLLAILFILVLLPYTLALLFIKPLPRLTSSQIFRWVNKLKPLFDAYTGPYKDKYRFWPGLQLVVRILVLTMSTLIYNVAILLVNIAVCTLLLSANYFYGTGVYKKRHVSVTEGLLLLNLAFWSMFLVLDQQHTGHYYNIAYFFAGLAFLHFWTVLLWFHVFQPMYTEGRCRVLSKFPLMCRQKFRNITRTWYTHSGTLSGTLNSHTSYEELMDSTSSYESANGNMLT